MKGVSEELFRYVDDFADAMVQRFVLERDQWVTSAVAVRAETVRTLLSGDPVDVRAAARTLDYPLDRCHLGLSLWTAGGDPSALPRRARAPAGPGSDGDAARAGRLHAAVGVGRGTRARRCARPVRRPGAGGLRAARSGRRGFSAHPPAGHPVHQVPHVAVRAGHRPSCCPTATSTGRSSWSSSSAPRAAGRRGRRLEPRRRAHRRAGRLRAGRPVAGPRAAVLPGQVVPGFGPIGPWLVTARRVRRPRRPRARLRDQRRAVQEGRTSRHDLRRARADRASSRRSLPLLPGDVIFTGTPAGVGAAGPPRFLRPGDVLTS